MFILDNVFLMFAIFIVVLFFVINPAIGWIMCSIVDSYNGKDKGYKRNVGVGFEFMIVVGILTFFIRILLALAGVIPAPF